MTPEQIAAIRSRDEFDHEIGYETFPEQDRHELLAHIDTLTAAVRQAFTDTRRMHVTLPEQGADAVDAAIGSALNDAEAAVLAILREGHR